MFDIGWQELLVIAVVLIVVVGPKDLPRMLRAFGKATARMRTMAGEFRAQFDEALREADLDDVRKTISDAQSLNPAKSLRDAMNPLRQVGDDIRAGLDEAIRPSSATLPASDDADALPSLRAGEAPAEPKTAAARSEPQVEQTADPVQQKASRRKKTARTPEGASSGKGGKAEPARPRAGAKASRPAAVRRKVAAAPAEAETPPSSNADGAAAAGKPVIGAGNGKARANGGARTASVSKSAAAKPNGRGRAGGKSGAGKAARKTADKTENT